MKDSILKKTVGVAYGDALQEICIKYSICYH